MVAVRWVRGCAEWWYLPAEGLNGEVRRARALLLGSPERIKNGAGGSCSWGSGWGAESSSWPLAVVRLLAQKQAARIGTAGLHKVFTTASAEAATTRGLIRPSSIKNSGPPRAGRKPTRASMALVIV